MNITITAFHGREKPLQLKKLLQTIFNKMTSLLPGTELSGVFNPSHQYKIHATLIGMETDYIDGHFYSHWFLKNRQKKIIVNIEFFTQLLKDTFSRCSRQKGDSLFTIRFGGYNRAYCTCADEAFRGWECPTGKGEFHSCGRSAYEGSFYAFAPGPAVFTGWPVSGRNNTDEFPHSLYLFRRTFEKAGFLDKYHSDEHPHWKNDDCHIKLGFFIKPLRNLPVIISEMRDFLRILKPVAIEIHPEDITFVLYRDTSLSENAVIEKLPLLEAAGKPGKLSRLFDRLRQMTCPDN